MNVKSNVITLLPPLVFNEKFLKAFVEIEPPCAALGIVEVRGEERGFISIKTEQHINGAGGFDLGTQLLGSEEFTMLHLIFNFGHEAMLDVLLNLNAPVAKRVMALWKETGEYFFFAFNDGGMVAFNNKIGQQWHDDNYFNFTDKASNSIFQFSRAEERFKNSDIPYGEYLAMVFQENTDFLDLTKNRFEMKSKKPE